MAYAPGRMGGGLVPREAGADADAEAEAAVVGPDLELLFVSLSPPLDEGWDAAIADDNIDEGASSEGQEDGPSPLAGSFWSMSSKSRGLFLRSYSGVELDLTSQPTDTNANPAAQNSRMRGARV